jgi:proliferating cell nuclear antigen PCNA
MNIQITNPVKADIFASVFQNMKSFSDNVNLTIDDNQLFIQAVDAGHVAIIELCLPTSWFDKCDQANATIGVNSTILFKILSTRDKCQSISIQQTPNSDTLLIQFTSNNKTVFDKTFEMPLLDLDAELMTIPEIDYQAEFSLPSVTFANLIHQLKMFGDSMDIECSEEKILLFSNSQNCGKMSAEISIDDLTSFAIEEGEQLNMSFSLAHLQCIAQFHKLSKEVELKFKRDYPLNVAYNLDAGSSLEGVNAATLKFYLAPKIQE